MKLSTLFTRRFRFLALTLMFMIGLTGLAQNAQATVGKYFTPVGVSTPQGFVRVASRCFETSTSIGADERVNQSCTFRNFGNADLWVNITFRLKSVATGVQYHGDAQRVHFGPHEFHSESLGILGQKFLPNGTYRLSVEVVNLAPALAGSTVYNKTGDQSPGEYHVDNHEY